MYLGKPPPAGASSSKLQFHLLSSSTRLIGMTPLHPQPNQLKISHPKIVYETESKSKDESGNRSEVETNEEVEGETEEEVEEETEEDVEEEIEEVIPIPFICLEVWKKYLTFGVTDEGGYGTMEELLEIMSWSQLGIHEKPVRILHVAKLTRHHF
ncbi:hypothetical protein ACH5RR_009097 [Cinchona calisaya]|uniref:cytokinin riboside 5'-monophosphate phosphoribohydrolase n=1 Tax=Cinchona calisaya TaxID=153742 RepID=A0ABD3AD65_9GENT